MSSDTLRQSSIVRPDHAILDVLSKRWSPRAFADRTVEPEKLRRLLEAARWAPSSYNEQPWRFIVAAKDDPDEYERLLRCLNEKNQQWAESAPVLMLTVARKHFTHNDNENRHARHDTGLAMGNLVAQATALDLYVHQMAGIRPDAARGTYGIPDEYEPVAGVAVGYLSEDVDERAKMSDRSRRPLRETVFAGSWGAAAPLVDTAENGRR